MTLRSRPQRIVHHTIPGSLLKRTEREVVRPRKDEGERSPSYLDNIRSCPCLHCGMIPSEAAHVRFSSAAFGKASGMQKKPADMWALPLCAEHHRNARDAQHKGNERLFWDTIDLNPLAVAETLWAARESLVAMEQVVRVAIAGRTR